MSKPIAKVIRNWPSSSGQAAYELRQGADGIVYCSCPGWRFSKLRPRECKHMVAWADAIAANGRHLEVK